MIYISKKWRYHKFILGLILFEFAPIVAILALTGIASPNTYRTQLWQEGGDHGFNSDPLTILYSYANYKPVKIPMVWSSFNTQFNLVVSVLAMFILLTKLTMHICDVWYPVLSFVVHAILIALWVVGIYAQTAPDTIDPTRINRGPPWYITKSCSLSSTKTIKGYCEQAKSTFAVSVLLVGLCGIHLILAVWSAIPTKEQKANRAAKVLEKNKGSPLSEFTAEDVWRRQWETGQIPPTPGTTGGIRSPMGFAPLSPMTPRTKAFNALDGERGLPLRSYA